MRAHVYIHARNVPWARCGWFKNACSQKKDNLEIQQTHTHTHIHTRTHVRNKLEAPCRACEGLVAYVCVCRSAFIQSMHESWRCIVAATHFHYMLEKWCCSAWGVCVRGWLCLLCWGWICVHSICHTYVYDALKAECGTHTHVWWMKRSSDKTCWCRHGAYNWRVCMVYYSMYINIRAGTRVYVYYISKWCFVLIQSNCGTNKKYIYNENDLPEVVHDGAGLCATLYVLIAFW